MVVFENVFLLCRYVCEVIYRDVFKAHFINCSLKKRSE